MVSLCAAQFVIEVECSSHLQQVVFISVMDNHASTQLYISVKLVLEFRDRAFSSSDHIALFIIP